MVLTHLWGLRGVLRSTHTQMEGHGPCACLWRWLCCCFEFLDFYPLDSKIIFAQCNCSVTVFLLSFPDLGSCRLKTGMPLCFLLFLSVQPFQSLTMPVCCEVLCPEVCGVPWLVMRHGVAARVVALTHSSSQRITRAICLFVFSTSFWNLEAGFYRVTHVGLELDLNCCCFSLLGLKVRTPSSSISFNYLNSNQSGPSPLYSTVDALQYKVDELHRFICKRDEPDASFRNSEPLSGDGSWGSGLICRILGSDTDFMFQRSNTGHEQEKRLTI